MVKKSALYYTDSQLDEKIASRVRDQLRRAFDGEIVAVSLKPLDFGDVRIVLDEQRGYLTMFKQILAGLEAASGGVVFHTEHDNLYHPSHFDFVPPKKNVFYYDLNWYKIHSDGLALHWDAEQVSGLAYYKQIGVNWYKERVDSFPDDIEEFDRKFEPMSYEGSEDWWAKYPSIDIRHNRNLTYNKRKLADFRKKDTAKNFQQTTIDKIEGWQKEELEGIFKT